MQLPEQILLLHRFDYDPDVGTWLWRPLSPELWCSNFERQHIRRWNTRYAGRPAGSVSASGYSSTKLGHGTYRTHRLIWKYMTGDDPQIIDHINHDRLDQRWSNLRSCTPIQSCANRRYSVLNRSGYKGVFVEIDRFGVEKYRARVMHDYKWHDFKRHDTKEQAALAAQHGRRLLHGDFAND